jgi:hypothetical protein
LKGNAQRQLAILGRISGGPSVLLNQPGIPQKLVFISGSAKKTTVHVMVGRNVR